MVAIEMPFHISVAVCTANAVTSLSTINANILAGLTALGTKASSDVQPRHCTIYDILGKEGSSARKFHWLNKLHSSNWNTSAHSGWMSCCHLSVQVSDSQVVQRKGCMHSFDIVTGGLNSIPDSFLSLLTALHSKYSQI